MWLKHRYGPEFEEYLGDSPKIDSSVVENVLLNRNGSDLTLDKMVTFINVHYCELNIVKVRKSPRNYYCRVRTVLNK